MSCSVNLVPAIRLHYRRRARRARVWLAACVAIGLLLATGWAAERTAAVSLRRLGETVGVLEVQQTEAQRRLAMADARRTELLEQLRQVTGGRRPQPWPQRFLSLMREAPADVFLTGLHVEPGTMDASRLTVHSGPQSAAQPVAAATELRAVRVAGFAADHNALLRFLHALQNAPDWQQVELIRAAQEPNQGHLMVAFELSCWAQEPPL
jgi:hypothetical protein